MLLKNLWWFPVSFRMKANIFKVAYKPLHDLRHSLSALTSVSIFLLTSSVAFLLFHNMPRISHLRFSLSGMLSPPGISRVYPFTFGPLLKYQFLRPSLATLFKLLCSPIPPIFPFYFSPLHFSKLNILRVLLILLFLSIFSYWSRRTLRAELFFCFILHLQCLEQYMAHSKYLLNEWMD